MKKKLLNSIEDLELTKMQIKSQKRDIVDIFNKLSILEKLQLDNDNNTLLHEIICRGNGFGANLIIPHMPNSILEQVDSNGFTCLHIAVAAQFYNTAKLLIKRTSQEAIDKSDNTGKTALHIATITNSAKVASLLLKRMSQEAIDKSDNTGKTALHHAAINNTQDVIRKIFLSDCMRQETIDKADNLGQTALMYAIHQKHFFIATTIAHKMSVIGLNITLMNSPDEVEVQNLLQQFFETAHLVPEDINSYLYKNKLLVILAWKDFSSSYHKKDLCVMNEAEIKMKFKNAVKILKEHTLSIAIPSQNHDNSLGLHEIILHYFAKIRKNILTYKVDKSSSNTSEVDNDSEKLIHYFQKICIFLEKNLLIAHKNNEFVESFKIHLDAMTNTKFKPSFLYEDFKHLLYAINSPYLYNVSTVSNLLEKTSVTLNTYNLLKALETKWGICEDATREGVLIENEYLEENEIFNMLKNIDLSKLPKKHNIAMSIKEKIQYFLKIFHITLEPQWYKDIEEYIIPQNDYTSNIIEVNNCAEVIDENSNVYATTNFFAEW